MKKQPQAAPRSQMREDQDWRRGMNTPCRICYSSKLGNVEICLDCIEKYKEIIEALNMAHLTLKSCEKYISPSTVEDYSYGETLCLVRIAVGYVKDFAPYLANLVDKGAKHES